MTRLLHAFLLGVVMRHLVYYEFFSSRTLITAVFK